MTQIELRQKFVELDTKVRECYIEARELLKEYDKSKEMESDCYHAVQNLVYNMILNGAQIADEWRGVDYRNPKSVHENCRKILVKKNV